MINSKRFCRCLNVEIHVRLSATRRRASSQSKAIDVPEVSSETWQTLVSWLNFDEGVDASLFESCIIDSISVRYRWLVSSKTVGTCQLFRCFCCQSDLFLSSPEIIGPAMMSYYLQTEEQIAFEVPKMKEAGQYSEFFGLILPVAASPQPNSPMIGHPLGSLIENIREQEEAAMKDRIDIFIRSEETKFQETCAKLESEHIIMRHASIACYRNHFGYVHPLLMWNPPDGWRSNIEPLRLSQVTLSDERMSISTNTSNLTHTKTSSFQRDEMTPRMDPQTPQFDVIQSTEHALHIQSSKLTTHLTPVTSNDESDLRKETSTSPLSVSFSRSSRTTMYSPMSVGTRISVVSEIQDNRPPDTSHLLPPTIDTVLDLEYDEDDDNGNGEMFDLDEDDEVDDVQPIDPSSLTPWEANPAFMFYGETTEEEKNLPTVDEEPVSQEEIARRLGDGRDRGEIVTFVVSAKRKPKSNLPKVMQMMHGSSMPIAMGSKQMLLSREKHTPSSARSRDRFSPNAFVPPHTIVDDAPADELAFDFKTRIKSMI